MSRNNPNADSPMPPDGDFSRRFPLCLDAAKLLQLLRKDFRWLPNTTTRECVVRGCDERPCVLGTGRVSMCYNHYVDLRVYRWVHRPNLRVGYFYMCEGD